MTAQIAERLFYEGREVALCTEPLGVYLQRMPDHPRFAEFSTALWRGYVGTWEIRNGRLLLIGLDGTLADGRPASLAAIFPKHPESVFAEWYTGTLRIPEGRLLEYVHGGYDSTYERDVLIDIEKGVVTGTRVVHNGSPADANAPEGYSVGAFTLFPIGKGDSARD